MDAALRLLLALVVIIGSARLLGALARRLGQPAVIGEILGGILLGPTVFAGAVTEAIFPADVRPTLSILASIGVCVFMFLVGLHLDHDMLRGQGRITATVALSSTMFPFGLGALLALYLAANHLSDNRLAFVLFLGTAMSVTAFPVMARILTDRGLIKTPIGGLALACAAVSDVLAWSLLAVVAAIAAGGGDAWRVLLVVPFAALMLKVVRPLISRLTRRSRAPSRPPRWRVVRSWLASAAVVVAIATGVLLAAAATQWMGLHWIFGAFLFGAAIPAEGAVALRERVQPWIEKLSSLILLPVFFVVAGIQVNLSALDGTALGELALILLVAIAGKGLGAFAGARVTGARPRHATVLAVLLNTRGLTELVVLTVGLQLGVLDQSLYSLMLVMALVTTAMAGVLLRLVYPPERVHRDLAAREADAVSVINQRSVPKESTT